VANSKKLHTHLGENAQWHYEWKWLHTKKNASKYT